MRGLREMSIDDKICTVMSIIQTHILATEDTSDYEIFGPTYAMPTNGLEMANRLLADVLYALPDDMRDLGKEAAA